MPAEMVPLLKGFCIGVAVAAPVGPMSVLCMRRTLTQGWSLGFGTGAGIALADAVYALIAASGLAGVTHFMLAHERPLHLVAGMFLSWLAVRAFLITPAPALSDGVSSRAASHAAAFGSALLLTLTNPPTIVSFVAFFTALAPSGGFGASSVLLTVVGVFAGSLVWWFSLTVLVARLRSALRPGVRQGIDRCTAAVLGLLGAAEIRRAL